MSLFKTHFKEGMFAARIGIAPKGETLSENQTSDQTLGRAGADFRFNLHGQLNELRRVQEHKTPVWTNSLWKERFYVQ